MLTWWCLSLLTIVSCELQEHESLDAQLEANTMFPEWFLSLVQNLFTYGLVIVPGALAIRWIKQSNYIEKINPGGWQYKLILSCVHGKQDLVDVEDLDKGAEGSQNKSERSGDAKKLIICVVGLQCSYLMWGYLQEKIMTSTYGDLKFKDSQFLVFMNRILALCMVSAYINMVKQPTHKTPLYKYSFSSFSNIMSSWCQYEALKYVSFPTQVICKASKTLAVILMGKVVSRKKFPAYEYVCAALIFVGVSVFLLWNPQETEKNYTKETTFSGLVILIGYIVFDSFTSNWQGELYSTYKMSSYQCMLGTNIFSSLFTGVSLLMEGMLFSNLLLCLSHPQLAYDVLGMSVFSMTGQFFIFYCIETFGPVVFTIIMACRQVLSIIVSCFMFGHPLTAQSFLGALIVFIAIFLRIYAKQRSSRASK